MESNKLQVGQTQEAYSNNESREDIMRTLTSLFFFLAISANAGSSTTTTPVFDFSGGASYCTPGTISMCTWSNWWNNATTTTTKWSNSGSYTDNSYVMSGKDITNNYAWGNSNGASMSTADSGAGWNASDFYNLAADTWNGVYAATDGWLNQWNGNSTQQNHTIANSIFSWLCIGAKCKEDFWSWNSNQYDYNSYYSSVSTLFGDYMNSSSGPYSFSSLTNNADHQVFEWDRYGTIVPTETSALTATPEPGSMAMIGLGFAALASIKLRRKR